MQVCVHNSRHAVQLKSYNVDIAPECLTSGHWPSHDLARYHTSVSITASGTPVTCFAVDQKNLATMGDSDMNELLLMVVSFYGIDLSREMRLTETTQRAIPWTHEGHRIWQEERQNIPRVFTQSRSHAVHAYGLSYVDSSECGS